VKRGFTTIPATCGHRRGFRIAVVPRCEERDGNHALARHCPLKSVGSFHWPSLHLTGFRQKREELGAERQYVQASLWRVGWYLKWKVALSVYAVDTSLSVVLLHHAGLSVPMKFGISAAYTSWPTPVGHCNAFGVQTPHSTNLGGRGRDMGRAEIFDRILNSLSIGLVSLILFDWLSV
jgi:hypothetical protein